MDGSIFNERGKELGSKDKDGYILVNILTKLGYKTFRAHRYIWEHYNGKIKDGLEIDHINGNRADNRIENLQAITKKQNNNRWRRGTVYLSTNRRQWKAERDGKYLGYYATKCGAQMACNLYYI